MIKTSPREYQTSIVNTTTRANTLVVLPTGLGKTLVALLTIINRLKEFPGSKALMVAPTRPLVEQHKVSFEQELPELFAQIELFTGEIPANSRKKLWNTADIIFSTPQCIANDLRQQLYNLSEVSVIVIDEAHRCLKNYDYTTVVNYYKSQAENPRILGLTASPGSETDKVKQICKNLDISEVEIRSRDSPDVKPYIQERTYDKVEVEFPKEFIEIRTLLKRIYDNKVDQLKSRSLLFGPANKITLLKLQSSLARQAGTGNGNAMYGMSLCAQAIKISHAIELLETQTLSGVKAYLDGLQKQADEKQTRGVQTLVNSPEFQASMISLKILLKEGREHPKIDKISEIIHSEIKSNSLAKILVFSQFRETVSTIVNRVNSLPGVRPSIFIGQAKKESGGMSQQQQKLAVENFREGKINVLCATSIGEEGLDIPEVNTVIFYEPVPSGIRKIQRAGRTARHLPGNFKILITKDTRDEINHYASTAREKKMYKTIESVKFDLKNSSKIQTLKDFI